MGGLQFELCTKGVLHLAKRLYRLLPLGYQTRARHRQFISRFSPRILLATGAPVTAAPPPNAQRLEAMPGAADKRGAFGLNSPGGEQNGAVVSSEHPMVSIIIPVQTGGTHLWRSLASLQVNPPQVSFELIVVVPEAAPGDMPQIAGMRVIRSEVYSDFTRYNIGVEAARGEFLHFLSCDAEVASGWLDELLQTFHEFPGAGMVGSKLIYPDGRLQGAGGIVRRNGGTWNSGRFQNPNPSVYDYAREVAHCSAVSVMVPRVLFQELGGFDESDISALVLRIRERGHRVIYQPLSVVFHHGDVSPCEEGTQGANVHRKASNQGPIACWQHRLHLQQAAGTAVDESKDRRARYRVLALDHLTPTPDRDAGSVTAFNLMLLLREMDFQVTFIPEDNFLYLPVYTTALQRAGIEALYAPYVTSVEKHLKEYGTRYDLVLLIRPGVVERHLQAIRRFCPRAKVLFETQDLHYLRLQRQAELQGGRNLRRSAAEMKQRELAAMLAVDATILHSSVERDILRPLIPTANLPYVFPLSLDVKGCATAFDVRKDIVFVGGYQHTPNVDAVCYFVAEIMPLLRQQIPGVRFCAVGGNPPPAIRVLAREDVVIKGFVAELTPLLNAMRVSVAPLRYGAGIKGKVGTAMAAGLPVVATSIAAEGMSLRDGEHVIIADGAHQFAAAVVRLYKERALWEHISREGLEFVEKNWGAEAAWKNLATIVADLGFDVRRSSYRLSLYSG